MTRDKLYLFSIAILFAVSLLGQRDDSAEAQARYLDDLQSGSSVDSTMGVHGEIVAQGKNVRPIGKLKVKTYRLERVGGGQYDLFVTGGPFRYGDRIWINDQALPTVISESGELLVQFIAYIGAPKFEEGATISVVHGAGTCHFDSSSESIIPDKLSVPLELRAPLPDASRTHLRTIQSVRGFGGKPGVEVTVTMKELIPVQNSSLVMQIARQEFDAGRTGRGYEATAVVPYDLFQRMPDNSQVIVKWGRCGGGGIMSVRLNKSMLDH